MASFIDQLMRRPGSVAKGKKEEEEKNKRRTAKKRRKTDGQKRMEAIRDSFRGDRD